MSLRGARVVNPVSLAFWLFLLAGAAGYLAMMVPRLGSDPDLVLLLREDGARWIGLDEPPELLGMRPGETRAYFRGRFNLPQGEKGAVLTVRALRQASIYVDGRLLQEATGRWEDWKRPRRIRLPDTLGPGWHEVWAVARNRNGPSAILISAPRLSLATGPGWEASRDATTWGPARPLDTAVPAPLSRRFPRADQALRQELPILGGVFLAVAFGTLTASGATLSCAGRTVLPLPAAVFRGFALLAWGVLAACNITRLPPGTGFDLWPHFDYIALVATERRFPLPTEGWQMFQSPLYYLVSAPLHNLLASHLSREALVQALRVVPLLCGALQVELSYRAARLVFPGRDDLQKVATLVGGFLPMNLYVSQVLGNEPLAALLSATALVLALHHLLRPVEARPWKMPLLLGLLSGLALLAKASAVLLLPPLLFLCVAVAWRRAPDGRGRAARGAVALGAFLGAAFLVSGWYYVRNWVEVGKPFIGGWEAARGILWWQYPGFRTPEQLGRFGQALLYPVGSSVTGFWDAVYSTLWTDGLLSGETSFDHRPPWNYGYLLAGAPLALVPALAMGAGMLSDLLAPARAAARGTLLALASLVIFYGAMFHLFLTLPVYSTVKASYTMGLTPCYALFAALGFDHLPRRAAFRAPAWGALAAWAVAAYLAYLVP